MNVADGGTTVGIDRVTHGGQVGRYPDRFDAIEWVRVIAACGVVWFHIKEGAFKDIGLAGLVCFVLISVVFQASGSERYSFVEFVKKSLVRLVPPWVFWFAFYGMVNIAKGKAMIPCHGGIAASVLTGTWVGLWYLPFILITSLVVFGLARVSVKWNPLVNAAYFLGIGVAMLMYIPQVSCSWWKGEPWWQWLHVLPAIPLGMGMYSVLKTTGRTRTAAMVTFLAVSETACLVLAGSARDVAVTNGVALLAVSVGFMIPWRLPRVITRLGGLCLGVYLMHAVFLSALKTLPLAGNSPSVLLAMTVVLSFAATSVMRRNRWLIKIV